MRSHLMAVTGVVCAPVPCTGEGRRLVPTTLRRRVPRALRGLLAVLLVTTLAACEGAEEEGRPPAGETGDTVADTLRPDTAAADTTAADTASRGPAPDRTGTEHPPMPEGVEKRAGTLVMRPGQDAADARLGLSDVVAGGTRQIWLSELLRRKPGGEPVWRVVDVVDVGAVGPEDRVMIHGCRSDEREWGVAAVMRVEEAETLGDARRAWRVVPEPPALEGIPPEGVRCETEGFSTP